LDVLNATGGRFADEYPRGLEPKIHLDTGSQ